MRRYALGVERAGPLVVVTTPSGYASALAQALDEGSHPGIAGTIAGDNTIFVAPREGHDRRRARRRAARAPRALRLAREAKSAKRISTARSPPAARHP